jgi:hypothetical protein
MFDHERSLVNRMAGKPFALIGVNVGDELDQVRKVVADRGLNWRSFFEGESDRATNSYSIQGYPTVYLLDEQGIIRHRFLGPPHPKELDAKIDELVSRVQ